MSDIVQDFTEYRIRQIEIAEAKYYESLIQTLDKIERDITSLAGRTLPTDDLDRLYEDSIDFDGIAHTLAAYDGEETTVDDYHIYRWN